MNILLVEDCEADALLFNRRFGQSHDVTVAQTAAEAMTAVRSNEIDVIVCDYFLPGVSDDSLVQILRGLGHGDKLIVFSGATRQPDDIEKSVVGFEVIAARIAKMEATKSN